MMEPPESRKPESFQNPRASVLEAYRAQISELVHLDWPLTEIRKILENDYQVKVAYSRLWTFCKTRNIVKGRGEVPVPPEVRTGDTGGWEQQSAAVRAPSAPVIGENRFAYDDDDISDLMNPEPSKSLFTIFEPRKKT